MKQVSKNKTPEQMVEAIFALDLDPIKFKLMDKDEGYGWTRAEADRHELEYRRFLALIARYPDEAVTPDKNVDRFWHGHILDTLKYAEDCEHVFGYFVHHFPYFGMRDAEDAANAAQAARRTNALYEKEFGTAASAAESAYCAKADASYCAKAADASYCAKAADASYFAKAGGKLEEKAYCAKAGASYCAKAAGASYCAKAGGKLEGIAYCAKAADSYCAKAAGTAYCAKAGASYCAKASSDDVVTGKGRPALTPA